MPNRFIWSLFSSYDSSGQPRVGAKLNFYESGTLVRKNTYSDEDLTLPNPNPIEANENGTFGGTPEVPNIYLDSGLYKVVLTTAGDVLINEQDPLDPNAAANVAIELPFLLEVLTEDLSNDESVNVLGYAAQNDGGRSFWIATGVTNAGSAGTLDLANGFVYDEVGTQFQFADPIINMKAFGAKGDTATNDYTAFANAITYAGSAQLPIYVPAVAAGNYYLIQSTLVIPGGITFYGGPGNNKAIIRYTGAGVAFQAGSASAQNDLILRNLDIYTTTIAATALQIYGISTSIFDNIYIQGLYSPFDNTRTNKGIVFNNINGADSTNNLFTNINISGVNLGLTTTGTGTTDFINQTFINLTINGNVSTDATCEAINLDGTNVTFKGSFENINLSQCNRAIDLSNINVAITVTGSNQFSGNTTDINIDNTIDNCVMLGIGTATTVNKGTGNNFIVWPTLDLYTKLDQMCPVGTEIVCDDLTIGATQGWLSMDALGTIGNASSGGTLRANADTVYLFTVLWNNFADAQCPVSTGRGASAAADFAANKTITIPERRSRALVNLGTLYSNGQIFGVNTVTLVAGNIPELTCEITGAAAGGYWRVYTSGGGAFQVADAPGADEIHQIGGLTAGNASPTAVNTLPLSTAVHMLIRYLPVTLAS